VDQLAKGFALDIPIAARRPDLNQWPAVSWDSEFPGGWSWTPSFYEHHKDSIRWRYRCFDRILLNGLIQPFRQPERVVGFFSSYRQLYPVSRNTLRGIAEQFQQWLKGWTEKRKVPVLDAPNGRRDDFVDPYFKGQTPVGEAVDAICGPGVPRVPRSRPGTK
jgi:hypothetical protein